MKFDWEHKWGTIVAFNFNVSITVEQMGKDAITEKKTITLLGKVENYLPSQKMYVVNVEDNNSGIHGIMFVPEENIQVIQSKSI